MVCSNSMIIRIKQNLLNTEHILLFKKYRKKKNNSNYTAVYSSVYIQFITHVINYFYFLVLNLHQESITVLSRFERLLPSFIHITLLVFYLCNPDHISKIFPW